MKVAVLQYNNKNTVLKHSVVAQDGYEQKTVNTQQLCILNLLCSF
jgi:hypothetical protein